MPYYIGLANTCHDPAVAVVSPEGDLVFAQALERYFQQKRAWDLPPDHGGYLRDVLRAHCAPREGVVVATCWRTPGLLGKPFDAPPSLSPGNRQGESLLRESDGQWLMWSQKKAYEGCGTHLSYLLSHYFDCDKIEIRSYDHHLTHAANACFTSPFNRALCVIADGEGEIGSVSSYLYDQEALTPLGRSWGPGSLGAYYAKLTEWCGFDWRKGEEGKVMGLAAYGQHRAQLEKELASLVRYDNGQLLQGRKRDLAQVLRRLEGGGGFTREDMACTGQQVFEERMLALLQGVYHRGGSTNLVLGGGCALNSSFNGKILRKTGFEAVHVPCSPADDGNAAGAAMLAFMSDRREHKAQINHGPWASPYLGSEMDPKAMTRLTRSFPPGRISHHPGTIHEKAAQRLSRGQILGWVQGRAEYGPRALGNRSILADPRNGTLKDRINREVKFREDFRPFAPAVLASETHRWFQFGMESPYMSFTLPFQSSKVDDVPAVVHKDGTGRLQTVHGEANPAFHGLITHFHQLTGIPLVLNTSMNIMGKPLVHSLEDAVGLFFTTGLDALVIGDYLIRKEA
ncbi:carbamoyltransferase family protein [Desulfoluna butyratoxydans]|uniref:Carbamoyltransferase n=1 Tax=Desulfoluna butyratoxydans TaxID=231438 RepID=A0A4U8YPE0_9BACT|nr:carbamoyltransferase C-terminal domain-containing protein [Desulfoluna butyratoxydans]VFQ46095.1 carbamoyltransferase [Desulfoluna butyratoxydans]